MGGQVIIMKALSLLLLLLLPLLLLSSCRDGEREKPVPERLGFVNDYADVFSKQEAAAMEAELQVYEQETCHQILVLTVQSLQGESIAEFSARTATAWKIGQPVLQDGVLITVATIEGKVRIETGKGLDFLVKDGQGEEILSQIMLPLFRDGHIAEGIKKGVEAFMAAAQNMTYPEDKRPPICR
jgi:uncharacterized protein